MKISTFSFFLALIFSILGIEKADAQRIYATSQQSGTAGICIGCGVTNPGNAVDGNPQTSSTVNLFLGLGAQVYQEAIFPGTVAANTPVSVKLGTGDNLLSATVLGGIVLQAYNGGTAVGSPVTASTLLTALNNNDQAELTITPTATYNRVRVTLDAGLIGAASTIYLYDAYYKGAGPVACNTAVDEFHGISSALLGLGLGVGGVANPRNSIDGDLNTAATLNAGVGLLGSYAQQTVLYNSPSVVGDSLILTLSIPQALVDAGVTSSITVRTFNGTINNNDVLALNSGLLNVRLLDLSNNRRRVRVALAPQNVFDRVQVRLAGGIAAVLSSLDLHEVQKTLASPVISINGAASTNAQICSGATATFTAASIPNTSITWYTAAVGGTPIFTGNTFTTPALTSTTTYYAQATRNGCTDGSARVAVTATVNPLPAAPTFASTSIAVNPGATPTLSVSNPQPGLTYNWYTAAAGGTPIFTGPSYTTPAVTASTTYYVDAVSSSSCTSGNRTAITINVNAAPDISINPPSLAVNPGQTGTFTATSSTPGATFNWYTDSVGGSPIFTGPTFITPPVNANITYYAEAVDPVTNAASPRAPATLTVNGAPDVAVTPPAASVNAGQTATFTASSSTSGATFVWYTSPTGGTPIFTGPAFTTPPITLGTTYYVEALDPATNAASPRATATVNINGAPDLTVTPPTANVNPGQNVTFTASSTTPGTVFNWYDDPASTQPIFTGAVFTSPAIYSNTVFYAQAIDPATNAASPKVAATVQVNGAPDITINPPVRNINPGESTTFTASSNTPGTVFDWYSSPDATSPIFSGPTFTTPGINANTTYYAEAVNPSTNATSPRATASVTVNGLPTIVITPPVRLINPGQSTTFTASSNTAGAVFNWYADPEGGSPIFTGPTFTTPALNTNTIYYASAVDPGTNATSDRVAVSVTINGMPDIVVTPPSRSINAGELTTFTASSTTTEAIFKWYTTDTGGTAIFTGTTFTTPVLNENTTYFAEAADPATGATSMRVAAYVDIANAPDLSVTPPVANVNPGGTATFKATSTSPDVTFNWYTDSVGGTPVFTGPTFTTPPVNSNITYYADATDQSTNAVSERVDAAIVVIGIPNITVTPSVRNVNERQTASFTASSTTPEAIFNWYSSETATTPIFTGSNFTSPPITGNTTLYVQAVDPATNGASERATATVTVNPAPSLTVTPPTQAVNPGQTATFTASSTTPGAIFNWYSSATATTPIFTGPVFKTPVINGTSEFYAESVNPLTGAASPRFKVDVTLNEGSPLVFIPNAFSPNGDGNNDQLILFGATISDFDMRVYNQWGQLIFHSSDYSKGWDGTWRGVEQPVGVYVYYVRGTTGDATKINKKGTITLIR